MKNRELKFEELGKVVGGEVDTRKMFGGGKPINTKAILNTEPQYTEEFKEYLRKKADGTWDGRFGFVPCPFKITPSKL